MSLLVARSVSRTLNLDTASPALALDLDLVIARFSPSSHPPAELESNTDTMVRATLPKRAQQRLGDGQLRACHEGGVAGVVCRSCCIKAASATASTGPCALELTLNQPVDHHAQTTHAVKVSNLAATTSKETLEHFFSWVAALLSPCGPD